MPITLVPNGARGAGTGVVPPLTLRRDAHVVQEPIGGIVPEGEGQIGLVAARKRRYDELLAVEGCAEIRDVEIRGTERNGEIVRSSVNGFATLNDRT